MFNQFSGPIDASTRYCAVYGYPVRHSASPAMQNAGIAALGLNWRYLAFEVHPEDLRDAVGGAKAMRFVGLNLTVPHKLLAMDIVEVVDDAARVWGAVNTLCFEGQNEAGEWRPMREFPELPRVVRAHGFNTDAEAISRSISEDLGLKLAGKRVLLLGAGGAGRTAALKLAMEGVRELWLVNRTRNKAETVAEEIRTRCPAVSVQIGYPEGRLDLMLNATSLGLKSNDPLPVETEHLSLGNVGAVYDMIYRPAETPLLKLAKAAGCRVANGIGMLLHQGAKALELWTGQAPPIEIMRQALLKNVYG